MRHDFLVFVPQEASKTSVSYNIYVYGVKKENPANKVDGCLRFTLDGNQIAVIIYYFSGFERAYVVTGWNPESREEKSSLPGVEGEVHILFTAIGKEFKSLKRVIKFLTEYSDEMIFKLPQVFWFRLCALIQGHKARKSNIMHLLHLTKEEIDFYGRQENLCTEISL